MVVSQDIEEVLELGIRFALYGFVLFGLRYLVYGLRFFHVDCNEVEWRHLDLSNFLIPRFWQLAKAIGINRVVRSLQNFWLQFP